MIRRNRSPYRSGLTLVELLVAVGIVGVVVALAIPSMRDWMIRQRVISTASEIFTDMRFARSEAVSRNFPVSLQYMNHGKGCYTLFRGDPDKDTECDCRLGAGNACTGTGWQELKTFVVPADGDISVASTTSNYRVFWSGHQLRAEGNSLGFLVSGGGSKQLMVLLPANPPQPSICAPATSSISGYKACP